MVDLLQRVQFPADEWRALIEAATDEGPVAGLPRASWRNAGWTTPGGQLVPQAKKLVADHVRPRARFLVQAQYGHLLHVANVCLGDDVTTLTLTRFTTGIGPDGTELLGADPTIEFVAAAGIEPWGLIRRVLPPLDQLRADPQQSPQAAPVELPPEAQAHMADLAARDALTLEKVREAPGLPPAAQRLMDTQAVVEIRHQLRTSPDDVGIGGALWLAGGGGLFRVTTDSGQPRIHQVDPGDLGFTVLWWMLGAIEAASR